jgi:hypothetical protein
VQGNTALPESKQSLYDEVIREQEAAHLSETRQLNHLAVCFLDAADGDPDQAAELFERSIDLLYEGGVLQMHRYRAVLMAIEEGL